MVTLPHSGSSPWPIHFFSSLHLLLIPSHIHLAACDRPVNSLNSCSCKHRHRPRGAALWQFIHTLQMCLILHEALNNTLFLYFYCFLNSKALTSIFSWIKPLLNCWFKSGLIQPTTTRLWVLVTFKYLKITFRNLLNFIARQMNWSALTV